MNETIAKGLLILAVLVGTFAAGGASMYVHEQKVITKLTADSAKYQGAVETATRDFEAKKREYEAQGQRDKEKADAKRTTDLAAARDDVARMRVERDAERGKRFLADAPPGSKCPDGQVCFDRSLFDAAHGGLVKSLRASADRCQAVELYLKSAMDWADGG